MGGFLADLGHPGPSGKMTLTDILEEIPHLSVLNRTGLIQGGALGRRGGAHGELMGSCGGAFPDLSVLPARKICAVAVVITRKHPTKKFSRI